MEYPKTVIIAITAHGVIPLYKEETHDEYLPHVFYLPKDKNRKLSVTKISAVVPGTCNITNPHDVDKNMKYLIRKLNKFDISTASNDKKIRFLDKIQKSFQHADKHQIREIQADLIKKQKALSKKEQKKTSDRDDIEEIIEIIELTEDIESDKRYLHYNQNYRRDTYVNTHKRDGILYKIYERKSSEHLKPPYDYKINVLNVTGFPDLFSEMNTRKSGRSAPAKVELNLEQIINYLYYEKQVNEIIIFDFSCSSFADAATQEPVLDERFSRITKNSLLKERLHGGTCRKTKTSTRRTNKKFQT